MICNRLQSKALLLLTWVFGCAESIAPNDHAMEESTGEHTSLNSEAGEQGDEAGEGEQGTFTGEASESSNGDRITQIEIDATSQDLWIHFDIDAGTEVDVADANWDLGFQRFKIRLNGGVSGDGGVETIFLADETLESPLQVPIEGWFSDIEDLDDDGVPEYAFGDWYDYDVATHVLTPKTRVWFLRSSDGRVYALEIVDYYDDAGTSGFPRFRYKEME